MDFILGLCQMKVAADKGKNREKAGEMVRRAAGSGARVIVLPEMWNCPYSSRYFPEYAEEEGGETWKFLSALAAETKTYLIGGSIPEGCGGAVYNTCFSFDPAGRQIGKHRKVHLFDIDVRGGIRFMESETLTAGDSVTVLETEFGKIGVGICFDVRFPELFRRMALEGALLMVAPGAFNMTTGPAHWELTMRARALDNQVYFAACSPARDPEGVYIAYGNSCVADPWGDLCGKTGARESIVLAEIDFEMVRSVRQQLPLLSARRPEVYGTP